MALTTKNRLRVSQGEKRDFERWAEGRYLESRAGRTIEDLRAVAVNDRLGLAAEHLREGKHALLADRSDGRAAVSRFYYAMYHALRAVCLLHHGGDDYQEHQVLPKHLPADLPDADTWSENLIRARLSRNRADYDVYPKSRDHWLREARSIEEMAEGVLNVARKYVRTVRSK